MLAARLTVFLGCLFTGLALCRATVKASNSALTKAAEEAVGAAGAMPEPAWSTFLSHQEGAPSLCSAEKQELGLALLLLPFIRDQFGEGTQRCPGSVFISRRCYKDMTSILR